MGPVPRLAVATATPRRRGPKEQMKRCLDLILGLLGLLLLSPLFVAIAVWTRLREGPPVISRQRRVGLAGAPFLIWKFRTMVVEKPGLPITAAGDPRITRTGRVLRKRKLDELPQLFNVVAGTMSLVGPRPEVPEYVDLEDPRWQEVLTVRPGVTDSASLAYFNEEQLLAAASDPERHYREHVLPSKLEMYLRYVRNRSLGQDLKILWRTVLLVMGHNPTVDKPSDQVTTSEKSK